MTSKKGDMVPAPNENAASIEEKAILVGIRIKGFQRRLFDDSLLEMDALAKTARVSIFKRFEVPRNHVDPAMVMGKGKAEELFALIQANNIHVLLFDALLSPMQERNLAKYFKCKIVDRVELILDIFAKRASSREAQVQVELAQLKYLLPRLTRMWVHLSRQYAGVGTRGPGETQLEIDRRRVREKIHRLTAKCSEVTRIRKTQRKGRMREDLLCFSLVGYTNAGKSSLFQKITKAKTLIADQLFCTLDPLSRKIDLPCGRHVLITDTVGFIRKLPHFLVDAFRATLEEVFEADIILHIIDSSATELKSKMEAVSEVMETLSASQDKVIQVLNKIDLVSQETLAGLHQTFPKAIPLSVKTGAGVDGLILEMDRIVRRRFNRRNYFFKMDALGRAEPLFEKARVLEKRYDEEGLYLGCEVDEKLRGQMESFEIHNDQDSV